MSSTSSNTGEFTYNELMEQYVKATRLIEHLKSQRNRSKRAFDKAMDLVLKYDARIAELEAYINQLIEAGRPLCDYAILVSFDHPMGDGQMALNDKSAWDALVTEWQKERETC